MSVFFAAMLLQKRGWQGFLENRAARLMLPMLLGVVLLSPILRAARARLYTYDRFVRATWIGALLNGRRHSRGLRASVHP